MQDSVWTYDELLALLGTSKKTVVTTEAALLRVVDLLNGASPDPEDPAHSYDEIALRCLVGLLSSGLYTDDAGAPGLIAWTIALPGFLRGKNMFLADPRTYLGTTVI